MAVILLIVEAWVWHSRWPHCGA